MRKLALLTLCVGLAGCGTADPFARGAASPAPGDTGGGIGSGGTGGEAGGGGEGGSGGTQGGIGVSFADDVDPVLEAKCSGCHAAGPGGLTITGDPSSDYDNVIERVTPGDPDDSLLLRKASGESHGGGAVLSPGSDPYDVIDAWISAGAPAN